MCTEKNRDEEERYILLASPLGEIGDVFFLERRLVLPLPDAFFGGIQEDAHTGRYLEVIPGRHDIGRKCLGCGVKHGENGGPGDTGPQAGRSGIIFTGPTDEVPAQINRNCDIDDG